MTLYYFYWVVKKKGLEISGYITWECEGAVPRAGELDKVREQAVKNSAPKLTFPKEAVQIPFFSKIVT